MVTKSLQSRLAAAESKLVVAEEQHANTNAKMAITETKLTATETKLKAAETKLTAEEAKLLQTELKQVETERKLTETRRDLSEIKSMLRCQSTPNMIKTPPTKSVTVRAPNSAANPIKAEATNHNFDCSVSGTKVPVRAASKVNDSKQTSLDHFSKRKARDHSRY
jgi:septal ring factor EnvC (AmiA/AmiB activator)